MELTRRGLIALGAGAAAVAMMPALPAHAAVEDAIPAVTGGAAVGEVGITLTTPESAETGPISARLTMASFTPPRAAQASTRATPGRSGTSSASIAANSLWCVASIAEASSTSPRNAANRAASDGTGSA